ncbi:MAG TPA: tryptophan-rich sensory protein [candidate division Zixibacteria bacterium]|nr:tryptophan-rich sensory protein [candidate division Zixibacteria bacterium]
MTAQESAPAPRTQPRRRAVDILGLLGWLILVFAVSFAASRYMPGEWYARLHKPSWTPPNWMFPVVWTLLYAAMAAAAWLVWRRDGFAGARAALVLFLAQLALNGVWTYLFFGRQWVGLALVDILALLAAVIITMVLFRKHDRRAGYLLAPYIVWLAYASTLNLGVLVLN